MTQDELSLKVLLMTPWRSTGFLWSCPSSSPSQDLHFQSAERASSNQFLTTLTASSRYSLLTFLTFTSTAASAGWSCYAWCSIRSILDEGLLMGIGCWALLWKWTSEKRLIRNWILVWKKKNVSFRLVIILKLNSIFTNSLFKVINIFTTFLQPLI